MNDILLSIPSNKWSPPAVKIKATCGFLLQNKQTNKHQINHQRQERKWLRLFYFLYIKTKKSVIVIRIIHEHQPIRN